MLCPELDLAARRRPSGRMALAPWDRVWRGGAPRGRAGGGAADSGDPSHLFLLHWEAYIPSLEAGDPQGSQWD